VSFGALLLERSTVNIVEWDENAMKRNINTSEKDVFIIFIFSLV